MVSSVIVESASISSQVSSGVSADDFLRARTGFDALAESFIVKSVKADTIV